MPVSRRNKILEVAKRLFAAKGFDGTSIRTIAKESGLSVAGMFHYFSSKEEILNEIIIEFVDSLPKTPQGKIAKELLREDEREKPHHR